MFYAVPDNKKWTHTHIHTHIPHPTPAHINMYMYLYKRIHCGSEKAKLLQNQTKPIHITSFARAYAEIEDNWKRERVRKASTSGKRKQKDGAYIENIFTQTHTQWAENMLCIDVFFPLTLSLPPSFSYRVHTFNKSMKMVKCTRARQRWIPEFLIVVVIVTFSFESTIHSLARLLACCCSLFFCTLRFHTQTHTHCRTDSAQKCQRQQIRATDTQNKINSKTNRIKFCVTVLFPFVLQYILPPTLLLLVLSSFQFSLWIIFFELK